MWFSKWYFTPFWLPESIFLCRSFPFDPMGQSASLLKCGRRARLKHRAQLAACQRCQEALAEGKSGYEAGPGTPGVTQEEFFQDLSEFWDGFFLCLVSCHYRSIRISVKRPVCQNEDILGLIWGRSDFISHIYQHSVQRNFWNDMDVSENSGYP